MATDPPPPYPGTDFSNLDSKSFNSCPNGCETGALTQGLLREHLQDCPLQLVECEFANAGCDVKVPRRDLARHMTENAQHHLMSATLQNGRMIKALHQELHQKMEEKDRQIADLQKQVEKLSTTSGFICHELVLTNFTACQERSATGEWYSKVVSDGLDVFKVQLEIDTNGIKPGRGHMTASIIPSDIAIQVSQMTSRLATFLVVALHLLNQLGDFGHYVVMDSIPAIYFNKPYKLSTGDGNKYVPLSALDFNPSTKTQYLVNNTLHYKLYLKTEFR